MTCDDIDECTLTGKEKVCENATCKNTPGAYECTCNAGYKPKYAGDVTSDCDDIDECKDSGSSNRISVRPDGSGDGPKISNKESSPCDSTGICVNTPGSYQCDCNAGFIKKNGNCINIDECAAENEDKNDCGPNTDCFDSSPGKGEL